jgi:hypothetical protein
MDFFKNDGVASFCGGKKGDIGVLFFFLRYSFRHHISMAWTRVEGDP